MKAYHTADSRSGLRLPHSGVLLGIVADALRLKDMFRTDWEVASYKTVQRYFQGERVAPETVEAIVKALVESWVPAQLELPAKEVGEALSLQEAIAMFLGVYAHRWDHCAANVNALLYPVCEPGDLPLPALRLFVLELGIRLGAWFGLRARRPHPPLTWSVSAFADGEALARFIDRRRAALGLTLEDLAELVGISTQALKAWRRGDSLPTNENLRELAKALRGTNRLDVTELQLRLFVGVQDLLARSQRLCGAERIRDLLAAMERTSGIVAELSSLMLGPADLLESIAQETGQRAESLRESLESAAAPRLWNLVIYGATCPVGVRTVQALAASGNYSPQVVTDLLALPRDWSPRIRYWMDQLGSAEQAKAFAADYVTEKLGLPEATGRMIAEVAASASFSMAGSESPAGLDSEVRVASLPREVRAAVATHHAENAASLGDLEGAIRLLRKAVAAEPTNAVLHFRLGAHLGEIGCRSRCVELAEEGIQECRIASQLDPGLGNARNEIGIILSNLRRHEAAEEAFADAEDSFGEHSHHWFTRGSNYLALRRYDAARDALQRAIDLNADKVHVHAMARLAATLMVLGKEREARRLGKRVQHLVGFDPTGDWQRHINPWGGPEGSDKGR